MGLNDSGGKMFAFQTILEDTARYAGQILAPAEGLWPRFFWPFGQKIPYFAALAVITLVTLSSNLSNFVRNQ